VTGGRFSPDGRLVVTGCRRQGGPGKPGAVDIWDAETGAFLDSLQLGAGSVVGAFFNRGGDTLTTALSNGDVQIWDLETGIELRVYRGHDRWVTTLGTSRDGDRIVTASLDGTARIWDAGSGEVLKVLEGHEGELSMAAFSPDGSHVVTKAGDGTARLWSASTGEEMLTINGVTSGDAVAFSMDGMSVLVLTKSGSTRSYPIDIVEAANCRKPRDLTPQEKREFAVWNPGEEEALRIVEGLFDELIFTKDVVAHLESDMELDDEIRREAIEFALLQEDNPYLLYHASLHQIRKDLEAGDFRGSVRYARALARLVPDLSSHLPDHVGPALYRCGHYDEAVEQLRRYDESYSGEPDERLVRCLGYLAMAGRRLGRREEAHEAFVRFRTLCGEIEPSDELSPLIDEVEGELAEPSS
jgi:hypothetical protein